MQGRLSHVKIAVGIVLVATPAIFAWSAPPTTSEKVEKETCNDNQPGSNSCGDVSDWLSRSDNQPDSDPCGDLSDWLSRAGPVPGYHVRPVHVSRLNDVRMKPTRLPCVMHAC